MAFVSYKVQDDPFPWLYFFWCVTGIISYATFAFGALKFLEVVPSYDTQDQDFQDLTFMGVVNSSYFATPQFLYYVGMHALGFSFINLITLQKSADKQFISGNNTYKDVFVVSAMACLYFFISGNTVLRNEFALSGYCNQN